MADEMDDVYDDAEEAVDTGAALTSGIVIVTFLMLLGAILMMMKATGEAFLVGPMR
ncbi:MAG: hypothetical protein R3F20_12450 [Planctomycetota bacterium]